jgi:hypothetical protein
MPLVIRMNGRSMPSAIARGKGWATTYSGGSSRTSSVLAACVYSWYTRGNWRWSTRTAVPR